MNTDLFEWLPSFFSSIWQFYSLPFPGLGLTVGQVHIGFFIVALSVRLFKSWFGMDSSTSYRAGSTNRPKIHSSRKGDEK